MMVMMNYNDCDNNNHDAIDDNWIVINDRDDAGDDNDDKDDRNGLDINDVGDEIVRQETSTYTVTVNIITLESSKRNH